MKMPNAATTIRLSDFDYDLPKKLIAQRPARPRDSARLMVLNKATGNISHRCFFDLPNILSADDVLVFNDSKVIPARIHGHKGTGGKIEIFLLKKVKAAKNTWQCLIGGKIKAGQKIILGRNIFAWPKEKIEEKIWLVEFNISDKKLFSLGETPLPPYIKAKSRSADYQTVFAKADGSVAAPTAGLHFTKGLLNKLKQQGVQIEFVTLHVGLGTFLPIKTENILRHKMHSELAEINSQTAKRLNQAKKQGKRIIAVGTTAARTLEGFSGTSGKLSAQKKETNIFIYPGYQFKFIDGLITNFHLPKSTLLILVSALAGKKNIGRAYQEAICQHYRFYSFGDGMLIE
jgi:S-adenosylmethionine:tRNA ribosyltransferase-isomerase